MMEIFIDGKNAQITLDGEKTIGEVLAGVSRYLESAGFCASALAIDGTSVSGADMAGLFEKSVEDARLLNIKTRTAAEMSADALIDVHNTVLLLEKNAAAADNAAANEAANDEASSEAAASLSTAMNFLKEKENALYNLISGMLADKQYGALRARLQDIINERKSELADPISGLKNMKESVHSICGHLENFPLDVQTGNDAQAARTVEQCSLIMRKFFRLILLAQFYGHSYTGILNSETMKEFNSVLLEFLAAYENKDIVLSGDIAEYELSARFKNLYAAVVENIR